MLGCLFVYILLPDIYRFARYFLAGYPTRCILGMRDHAGIVYLVEFREPLNPYERPPGISPLRVGLIYLGFIILGCLFVYILLLILQGSYWPAR